MEFKPLFYSYLVLCVIVFFEVLINIRKNSFIKICFLLIISSLFVMNYFSYFNIESRAQLVLVKSMRVIYLCCVLLVIIHLVSPRIPRWIIGAAIFSFFFLVGIRVFYFHRIDIEHHRMDLNPIFSVSNEFYAPLLLMRISLLCLLMLAGAITLYYYRQFLSKPYKENIYYQRLKGWVISLIAPYLLLILFGILMILNVFSASLSPYLFSFFSCTIILSILFRPKFLNNAQAGLAFIPIQKQVGPTLSPQLFNNVFFNDFYYLEKEASIVDLAGKLQTSETNIREYLQQEYGMGISDFLNKYRINYMLDLLNDPKNRNFTIEHLSLKAGFPSRSTMYRAFSKFHGGNPTDYVNKLNGL